jgi:hypothetical protein
VPNQFEGVFAYAFARLVAAVMMLVVSVTVTGAATGASARPGHDIVYLATTAPSLRPATSGYTAPEANFDYSFDGVLIQREQHGTEPGEVNFATAEEAGQANEDLACGANIDYRRAADTKTLRPTDTADVFIQLCGDNEPEAAETFKVRLSEAPPPQPPGMVLSFPREATVTIVDDDGPDRFSFATSSYSQFENRGVIEVMIVRQGEIASDASVTLTTADGSASAGADYQSVNQSVQFLTGQRVKRVPVTLLDNCRGEPTETFSATLTNSSGPALVAPTTTTVDILDDDGPGGDSTPPVTTFHIPQNGKTYGPRHTATKQVHISPSDEASGLDHTCGAMVQLALRRKMRNGSCQWWGGSIWRSRPCDSKRWLKMPLEQCDDPNRCLIFYILDKRLKPTTRKTGIAYYKAWTRSRDTAGNLETEFEAGRNMSRFRVRS